MLSEEALQVTLKETSVSLLTTIFSGIVGATVSSNVETVNTVLCEEVLSAMSFANTVKSKEIFEARPMIV